MGKTAINTIKEWFKTGKYPTQSQFWNWLDSFWHKDDVIPISQINNLETLLDGKANIDALINKADLGDDGKILPEQIPVIASEDNRLVSGGIFWTGQNYDYCVNAIYILNGLLFNVEDEEVSLVAADEVHNRFDVVLGNDVGNIIVKTGVAEENPIIPTVNDNEIILGVVLVHAGTTEPLPDSVELIYNENNLSTEWTGSVSDLSNADGIPAAGTVDFEHISTPYKNTKCIHAEINNKRSVLLTRDTPINLTDYSRLTLAVRLYSGVVYDTVLSVTAIRENGSPAHTGYISLFSHGLNRNIRDTWQLVSIPISAFQDKNLNGLVKSLRFRNTSSTTTNGNIRIFDLDYIMLEKSIATQNDNLGIAVEHNGIPQGKFNVLNFENAEINTDDDKISVSYNGGSSNVKRFPKDASLTSEHIGLLAMQQITELVPEPSSLEDFEIKAVLCNTTPGTPGVKGVYKIEIDGIIKEHPVTSLIRVDFSDNVSVGDVIQFNNNAATIHLTFATTGNLSTNEVEVGATLADTISNIINHFDNAGTDLTNLLARVNATNNATYVEFEMGYGHDEETKYVYSSNISAYVDMGSVMSFTTTRNYSSIAYYLRQIAQNNFALITAQTWDNGQLNSGILMCQDIYIYAPYGTSGAFGLKYFADHTEAINALNYAFSNNADFNEIFDITSPIAYNSLTEKYEMIVQNKTTPVGDSYQSTYAHNGVGGNEIVITIAIQTPAEKETAELVRSKVLGIIVGVDGNDVLIDTSFMLNVQLCSTEEGALGVIPLPNNIGSVFAWRNGTVIDFMGYMNLVNNDLLNDYTTAEWYYTGVVFNALSPAQAGGTLTVYRNSLIFGN